MVTISEFIQGGGRLPGEVPQQQFEQQTEVQRLRAGGRREQQLSPQQTQQIRELQSPPVQSQDISLAQADAALPIPTQATFTTRDQFRGQQAFQGPQFVSGLTTPSISKQTTPRKRIVDLDIVFPQAKTQELVTGLVSRKIVQPILTSKTFQKGKTSLPDVQRQFKQVVERKSTPLDIIFPQQRAFEVATLGTAATVGTIAKVGTGGGFRFLSDVTDSRVLGNIATAFEEKPFTSTAKTILFVKTLKGIGGTSKITGDIVGGFSSIQKLSQSGKLGAITAGTLKGGAGLLASLVLIRGGASALKDVSLTTEEKLLTKQPGAEATIIDIQRQGRVAQLSKTTSSKLSGRFLDRALGFSLPSLDDKDLFTAKGKEITSAGGFDSRLVDIALKREKIQDIKFTLSLAASEASADVAGADILKSFGGKVGLKGTGLFLRGVIRKGGPAIIEGLGALESTSERFPRLETEILGVPLLFERKFGFVKRPTAAGKELTQARTDLLRESTEFSNLLKPFPKDKEGQYLISDPGVFKTIQKERQDVVSAGLRLKELEKITSPDASKFRVGLFGQAAAVVPLALASSIGFDVFIESPLSLVPKIGDTLVTTAGIAFDFPQEAFSVGTGVTTGIPSVIFGSTTTNIPNVQIDIAKVVDVSAIIKGEGRRPTGKVTPIDVSFPIQPRDFNLINLPTKQKAIIDTFEPINIPIPATSRDITSVTNLPQVSLTQLPIPIPIQQQFPVSVNLNTLQDITTPIQSQTQQSISVPTRGFIPLSPLLGGGGGGGRGRRKRKKRRAFQYTPSLTAVFRGITGPQPKRLTGFGIRPVPVGALPKIFRKDLNISKLLRGIV